MNKLIGIDLFAGAGGLSLGASLAGIEVCKAIEIDKHASATYMANHKRTKLISGDISTLELNLDLPSDAYTIVFGGPPCQGFSTSNQKTRSIKNNSNWLFKEFIRVVQEIEPDWVVFENVTGLRETENGYFLKEVTSTLSTLGYTITEWVLCATDFGVPQKRSRLFIIGSISGKSLPCPKALTTKYVTVKDAIYDLPILKNGCNLEFAPYRNVNMSDYAKKMRGKLTVCTNHCVTKNNDQVIERYKHIKQGQNWESIPSKLMSNYKDRLRCHTGIYYRLKWNSPSVVIGNFRKNMLIHPSQNRGLSVREAARLQSFPDWYEFKGSIGFQQQQVGNAVPPLLAQHVFKQILEN